MGDLALDQVQLTPRLVLTLLLPALLFEATLHIEARTLRRTLVPINILAIPGVVPFFPSQLVDAEEGIDVRGFESPDALLTQSGAAWAAGCDHDNSSVFRQTDLPVYAIDD